MSDDPDNIVLVYLRRMDAKIDRVVEDIAEVKLRQNDLTRSVATLPREQAGDAEGVAHLQAQIDRMRDEMDRIKRRLDISDA